MRGMPDIGVYRDKDIPDLLLEEAGPSFGLIGSDVLTEQELDCCDRLAGEEVAAIDGLRFALAARPDKVQSVRDKLDNGQPVIVGTAYPRIVKTIAETQGLSLEVGKTAGGQIESLANRLRDRLDGIVDIVDTGKSLREQNLRIVADNLLPVSLYGIWTSDAAGEPSESPV
jgi:ATP phosphoribosyltransferase